MKKVLGMATAAVLGFGLFTATADAATIVNTSVLNVRQGPGTNTAIVGKATRGQALNVTERLASGWIKIDYNGAPAYVSGQYTMETASYIVNASVLNVRQGAGTHTGIIGQLVRGQNLILVEELSNGWMKINYNGKPGYVSSSYVTKSGTEPANQKEFYVEATSYSPYCEGCSGITAAGYDVRANPNMKLIAVDPAVIPLGKRVYVEGYGEAVAGDTGGAIKGKKIDALMPTNEQALQWGRKVVKIQILD